jgi:uncharacterized membrane protein
MSEAPQTIPDIPDDAVQALLTRAARICLVLGLAGGVALLIGSGWRNAAMLAIGALISAASIWEWKRLAQLIQAKLNRQQTPRSAPVAVMFFVIRLSVFAGVIYGSLKCFQGSPVALLCGLGLAAIAVGYEAVRLLAE